MMGWWYSSNVGMVVMGNGRSDGWEMVVVVMVDA